MSEIIIDGEKCSGCSMCTGVCPYFILEMNDEPRQASVNPAAAGYCSRCGHCEAICPEGAIAISYSGSGPVPDLTGQTIPTVGQLSQLITARRSIRDYQKTKVPREVFEQIFEIIRYAPTGMNGQSVHWMVIQEPKDVQTLVGKVIEWAREIVKTQPNHPLAPLLPRVIGAYEQGSDKICHGAPHLVFAHGHKDNPVGFVDSMIALTHLDLTAPVFGLGTCWAGIVQIALDSSPDLMKSIGLPADYKSHYAMMIGYPKYKYQRIPKRDAAKIIWK